MKGDNLSEDFVSPLGFKIYDIYQFGHSGSYIKSIYIDNNNFIYVTGYTSGTFEGNSNSGDKDSFVAKFNSSLVLQWIKQFGVAEKASNYEDELGVDLVADSSGNVYVIGNTTGNLNGQPHLVI